MVFNKKRRDLLNMEVLLYETLEIQLQFQKKYAKIHKVMKIAVGGKRMEIVKYVLIGIYVIVCLALIVVAMIQSKDDSGASGTIMGSTTNNFYEKNKGRTKEGKLKKWTIILGILFAVLTVVLSIVYAM